MKKSRAVAALCLVALATSAVALSGPARVALPFVDTAAAPKAAEGNRPAKRENAPADAAQGEAGDTHSPQAVNIPTHVVYGMLFKESVSFKKKAHEREQKGEDSDFFRDYQRNKLKLHGAHAAAFDRIADAAARNLSRLDERAKKIIDEVRAQHPGGKLKEGELPPAPPAQLKALDKERTDMLMRTRDELRAALGEAEFQRLENHLLEDAAKTIKQIRPGGGRSASFVRQDEMQPAAAAQQKGGE